MIRFNLATHLFFQHSFRVRPESKLHLFCTLNCLLSNFRIIHEASYSLFQYRHKLVIFSLFLLKVKQNWLISSIYQSFALATPGCL